MEPETRQALLAAAREMIEREAGGLRLLAANLDDSFVETAAMLLDCEGKTFVIGAGTSGAMARRMAHLLSVCGTPAVFMQPMDGLHGTMGAIQPGDLVIAISRGGESDEINELSRRAQRRGARVIALTARPASSLGELADLTVVLDSPDDIDPGGVIAMGSTLVVGAWGDALALVLMRVRGYGWDEVLYTHPQGAVGKLDSRPTSLGDLPRPVSERKPESEEARA